MVLSVVKNAISWIGSTVRIFLGFLKRRAAFRLRSLAVSRSYRIPDSVSIVPAPAVRLGAADNSRGTYAAEIYTANPAESEDSGDQYAQLEIVTAAAVAEWWTGVAVRIRRGGQEAYVGICRTDHRKSELILGKRVRGKVIRLGQTYRTEPLAAGTRLRLVALGSTIAFMENDVIRIAAGDKSLVDGMPGVIINDGQTAGKWFVGPTCFEAHNLGADLRGITTYSILSATNSGGPHLLRVLRPAKPNPRVAHNFLFVLPVEEGIKSVYGDGLHELQSLDAQNKYNVTIIEPSFGIEPWYADNPDEPDVRHETFMTRELISWVRATLTITGDEQNWLIGFSKSGLGGQTLLLKHPDVFDVAASWDFPADMRAHDEYGPGPAACYGTDANFQDNYRLTSQFLLARRTPFLHDCRIWICQGSGFTDNVSRYESILATAGVRYMAGTALDGPHRWDSGWLPAALAALHECSIELARTKAGEIEA